MLQSLLELVWSKVESAWRHFLATWKLWVALELMLALLWWVSKPPSPTTPSFRIMEIGKSESRTTPGNSTNPKQQRENTHQGAIAVAAFIHSAGQLGGQYPVSQAFHGRDGCVADVEHFAMRRPHLLSVPGQKGVCNVPEVISITQAFRQAKGKGTVVRPCTRWLVMGAVPTHVLNRVFLQPGPADKFYRHTEGISCCQPEKGAFNVVFQCLVCLNVLCV